MLRERNFYNTGVNKYSDHIYVDRQKTLRNMERERGKEKLPVNRGKTWEELMAWARMHYGETWYAQREALDREEREEREILDPGEREKKSLKAAKRWLRLREMQWGTDESMLAEGTTWHEIMAWPADRANVMPSVEMGSDAMSSPSTTSGRSDRTGYSTYPPTPTDFRRQAMDGPEGPDPPAEWQWERLEWNAVRLRLSKAQYKENKVEMAAAIRSSREDEECERRNREEWETISALKRKDQGQYYLRKEQHERRMKDLDLQQKGWTQEQIDTMHQEEAAARERQRQRWESLLGREPKPSIADGQLEGTVVSQPVASPPRQTKNVSRRTRNGNESRPLSGEGSRKTGGGRITKYTAQTQNAVRRSTPSRQLVPIPSKPSTQGRGPNRSKHMPALDEPDTRRRSRRLAKQLPEFGMLPGRYKAPLSDEILRQPSNARKTSSSAPRNQRLSKPSQTNTAKPRGISKSRQARTNRPRRSVKG
jgi:hypothetical protein